MELRNEDTLCDRAAKTLLSGDTHAEVPLIHGTSELAIQAVNGLQFFADNVPRAHQSRYGIMMERDPTDRTIDDGIIRRENAKHSDQKLMLHVRPDLLTLLEAHAPPLSPCQQAWITKCLLLWEHAYASLLAFAHAIDQEEPGLYVTERAEEARRGKDPSCLRINLYDAGERGFAKPHVDRGATGITLHLGHSCPDLYFLRGGKRVFASAMRFHYATAFFGHRFEEITAGAIKAAVHGTQPPVHQEHSRWSVVFFGKLAA